MTKFTGANSLTFIMPAEVFPTSYRCTCHGISAAAGKLGSMIAIVVVYGINSGYTSPTRQGLVFILFSIFMAMGAVYSWAYLPDVQRRREYVDANTGQTKRRFETKSLEELGEGRERARRDGEIISVTEKLTNFRRQRRGRREANAREGDSEEGYAVRGRDIGMR